MRRTAKTILAVMAALAVLVVAAPAALLLFGPVAISDPAVLWNVIRGRSIGAPSAELIERRLRLPSGAALQVYAEGLSMPRMLRFTGAGDLLVSQPRTGEVVLLAQDRDGDGRADGTRVLLAGLDRPHGLDLADGWLYVAERVAIGRVRLDEGSGALRGPYTRIVTGLTGDGHHWSKTVRIGPDGMLYLSQGSTCNVCQEKDARRATVMRFAPDGSGGEILATGLRNSVGLDWAPWDDALYATENGRDLLGDDVPPDELNRIVAGGFYGWPYIHGAALLDPDLGRGSEALLATAIAPAHAFRAHTAPLGIRFLRHPDRPPGFERAALVALHGSWNRSEPDGYEVVSLHWDDAGRISERPFLAGFRGEGRIIGRPVDVAEGPDGAIYVSDDYAGVVYRIVLRSRQ